jgi:hypothetical protein
MSKNKQNHRELKVYTKYYQPFYKKQEIVPEIRLKGVWLSKWGYNCGDLVKITRLENSIIIQNLNSPLPVITL